MSTDKYDVSSSDNGSEASSTLSEFVRHRTSGKQAIFGGNPRVGLHQFAGALGNSVGSIANSAYAYGSDLYAEVRNLQSAVAALQQHRDVVHPSPLTPRPMDFTPIRLINNEDKIDVDFARAAQLDMSKVALLLEASMIDSQDVASFQSALRIAKHSSIKKLQAIDANNLRRVTKAAGFQGLDSSSDMLQWDVITVHTVAQAMQIDNSEHNYRLVAMALTHESLHPGLQTNRGLAQYGDVVLKLFLMEKAQVSHNDVPVSVINDVLTLTQSDKNLYDKAIQLKLSHCVMVGKGVDPNCKVIMATVVEALYAVAYLVGNRPGVYLADEYFGIIRDGMDLVRSKMSIN